MSDTKSDPKLDVSNPPAQKLDKLATSNISKAELREHIDRLIFRWFGEPVQVVEDDIVTLIADQQRQLLDRVEAELPEKRHKITGELKDRRASGFNECLNIVHKVIKDIREGL